MNLLFPKAIDNQFRGRWIALVLFVPIVLMKIAIGWNVAGLNPYMSPYEILRDVDGVPMDSFARAAVSEIEYFGASWGVATVIIGLFGLLALIRYRAMIPLAILMVFLEQSWRQVASIAERLTANSNDALATGSLINIAFSILLLAALLLSIIPRRSREGSSAEHQQT